MPLQREVYAASYMALAMRTTQGAYNMHGCLEIGPDHCSISISQKRIRTSALSINGKNRPSVEYQYVISCDGDTRKTRGRYRLIVIISPLYSNTKTLATGTPHSRSFSPSYCPTCWKRCPPLLPPCPFPEHASTRSRSVLGLRRGV